ncbi:hypothetical protein T4B_11726 [Trichinella pseudospiralis]|uniref:Uncharacterized protein n=1 Tax=Trichinella pseudospiralis TaxID=6337 RepID=A0A0V1HYD6_TRIPS|nr:hypothetical protein T4B_11726 [Trichinella pseudospiralis]KRZ39416.1 hypothetical protein T4C_7316 [Trichinella pseudospiralis]
MKKRMTRSRVEKKPNEESSMGLYSADKGECEIFPCSLSRRSAEFWSLNGESLCRRGGETLLLWHPWKRGVLVLFCSLQMKGDVAFPKFRGGAVCCSFPHTAAVEYFGCGGDQPAQPSGTPADHHCPTTCTFHFLNQESCVPEVEVSTQNGSYTSIYSRRFRHNDP